MQEENYESSCISHLGVIELDESIVASTRERLIKESANLAISLEEELNILDQLTQFELGRFLLQNKGLDGYWIDYIISGDHNNVAIDSLEYWILNNAPIVVATQERFKIFQNETQKRLESDMTLASIPCGAMNDLLLLDYSKVLNIHLVGVDIDQNSIELAQRNINKSVAGSFSAMLEKNNAWDLNEDNKFDLITSNGLNIYESSEEKLIELYANFYKTLSSKGVLITSFISKSPGVDINSPWKNIDLKHLVKQKALFLDVIQAKWQNSLTEPQVRYQLGQAGFEKIEIIYDSQGMFPTVIATR